MIERGDWVQFNLTARVAPQARKLLVTEATSTGMIRLLDKEGYYAAWLFTKVEPPKETMMLRRKKA